MGGYFARWTTDFDCQKKTNWWYCIKDTPIDLNCLSSSQRYRINRGLKNYKVSLLCKSSVAVLIDDIFAVYSKCNDTYGATKISIDESAFKEHFFTVTQNADVWGVFDNITDRLVGYSICGVDGDVVYMRVVKVKPESRRNKANAALAYSICRYYINENHFRYVSDGERNIRHETNYQDYLVNNIGFRYSYCHLHICYSPIVGCLVRFLYPFRELIKYLGKYNRMLFNVYCVLKQESYTRK